MDSDLEDRKSFDKHASIRYKLAKKAVAIYTYRFFLTKSASFNSFKAETGSFIKDCE